MDSELTLSVIMLAKNKSEYVIRAAESVLIDKRVELIIVEPGSFDDSRAKVEEIQNRFGESVQLVLVTDDSPAEGLNNGLSKARGDFVSILNADDFYLKDGLLRILAELVADPKMNILCAGGEISNSGKNSLSTMFPSAFTLKSLLLHSFGAIKFLHQGIFVRTSIMLNYPFNPRNRISWDIEQFISMFIEYPKIRRLRIKVAVFNLNAESISSRPSYRSDLRKENLRLFKQHIDRSFNYFDYIQVLQYRLVNNIFAVVDSLFYRAHEFSSKYALGVEKKREAVGRLSL